MVRWSSNLAIGIAKIDVDHETLFDMINDFEAERLRGVCEDILHERLTEIGAFAKYKFLCEEHMLFRRGFANLNNHCEKHAKFIDMIFNASLAYQINRGGLSDIGERLSCWMDRHIRDEDAKFAPRSYDNMIYGSGCNEQVVRGAPSLVRA